MSGDDLRPMALDDKLAKRLIAYCDQRLSRAEVAELEQQLIAEPRLQMTAMLFMRLHAEMVWEYGNAAGLSSADSSNAIICSAISLLDEPATSQPLRAPRPPAPDPEPSFISRWGMRTKRRFMRAAAAFQRRWSQHQHRGWAERVAGVAIVTLLVMLFSIPIPPKPPTATLVESANVRWAENAQAPLNGDLEPGLYGLRSGIVKLRTLSGVEVNLEAPCRFELISESELRLNAGTLYAEARGPLPELAIQTPTAVVHDFGTAFGVSVAADGSTDTVVFEGVVSMSAPDAPDAKPVLIPEAFASRVSASTGRVEPVRQVTGVHEYLRFPQRVTQRVWLANLICEPESGDVSDCNCGINLATGQRVSWDQRLRGQSLGEHVRQVDGRYVSTPDFRAIDGVFVPNREVGVVLDGAGSTFDGFPKFDNQTFGDLWAGRPFPERELQARLAGVGPNGILMHAPKGITIDLTRVPAGPHAARPVRFRAALLNCADLWSDDQVSQCTIDFWVLIDGQLVYQKLGLIYEDGYQVIDVPIPANAHYLTLASTIGSDGTGHKDFAILDNAMLEMGD